MKKLFLIGGGGHCISCIDVIELHAKYQIVGIFDLPENVGKKVSGYPVVASDQKLGSYVNSDVEFLITIGHIKNSSLRTKIYESLLSKNAKLATVVSPRAYVAKSAVVGAGSIVMHDALVNADAKIGSNCIINSKVLIEHGVSIGDHTHIATAAVINGDVKIGARSFVGSNSVIRQLASLPEESFVNAGVFYNERI